MGFRCAAIIWKVISLRRLPKILLWSLPVLLFFLILSHNKAFRGGTDFKAYYLVSERLWRGELIYNAQDPSAFKYAPITAYLFMPLALLDFDTAKLGFALINGLVVWALPLIVLFSAMGGTLQALGYRKFMIALGLGLITALRFIDNEFHSAQVNGLSLAFVLFGSAHLFRSRASRISRVIAMGLMGFGALFKFHPLFSFGIFLKPKSWRWIVLIIGCVGGLVLFPDPRLWGVWLAHMKETTPYFEVRGSGLFQGFYPFFVQYFGTEPWGPWAPAAFLVCSIPVLILIPKIDLGALSSQSDTQQRLSFYLSLGALLLFAVTSSPLPWHHTYLPLWVFVPLSFLVAQGRAEKLILFASVAAIGLSSRGVVGRELADWLEVRQVIFLPTLALVFLLIHQSRRLAPGVNRL